MNRPLDIPNYIYPALDELYKAIVAERVTDPDFTRRQQIYDCLRRMSQPTAEERKLAESIKNTLSTGSCPKLSIEKSLDELCKRCKKWLVGKLIFNPRKIHYMYVTDVTTIGEYGSSYIYISGPVVEIDGFKNCHIVKLADCTGKDILIGTQYLSDKDYRTSFNECMERFHVCDMAEIEDNVKECSEEVTKYMADTLDKFNSMMKKKKVNGSNASHDRYAR